MKYEFTTTQIIHADSLAEARDIVEGLETDHEIAWTITKEKEDVENDRRSKKSN